MRLHRLELAAFGPFAERQVIDFDELTASGLFLLDGPTGAGKTTVLDAITFALYGPGERNGDGRLRSDFAPRDCAPKVVLDFSVHGVRHRVTRSPEFERPKRRGAGTTRQAAQAHLERFEGDRWVSRSSNKAEIADMLADVLGLNRDQFTQVVVLPQGEFARFLRASDDDRRALLTKLFGTQLYDRITDELERQGQAATRDLDAALRLLRSCVSAAGEAAGMPSAEREQLCDLEGAHLGHRLEQLQSDLTATHLAAQAVAADATARSAATRERFLAAEAAVLRVERFAAAVHLLQKHDRERPAHDAARLRLDAAQRAERVRGLLDALDESAEAVADATAVVQVLDPHVDPDDWTSAAIDDLDASAANLLRQAAELQHLADQERELAVLREESAAATRTAQAAGAHADNLRVRLDELPGERKNAERELATAREAIALGAQARVTGPGLQVALDAAQRIGELTERRASSLARREDAVAAHQRAVDDHQRAVDARLQGMAGELAHRLADGAPCPVCGATEHPQPAQAEPDAVRAAQIQDLAARRTKAEASRAKADSNLAALDAEIAAAHALRGSDSLPNLQREATVQAERITAAEHAAAVEPSLHAAVDALVNEERVIGERLGTALSVAAATEATARLLTASCADLAAALDDAREDHPSVAARQSALRMSAKRAAELAAAARMRATAVQQYEQGLARAQRQTASVCFDSVDDARAALLTTSRLAELQQQVDGWERNGEQLAATVHSQEFTGLAPDSSALVNELALARAMAATSSTELDAADSADERAAALAATAAHACHRFAQACVDVDAARSAYDRDAADSEAVRYLSRLTRGMAGRRRVALTTFVLRRWFEHVVQAANVRLLTISSGRYELVRVDEAAGRAERAGLTLQVIDRHTGQARPSRSLSGGETFYTSLALALGLADVVRAEAGGIDLDTLFIDEGFGTLDPQTLDEVMTVIEDLRDRGRVIGIVSHVADLKELVHERVEVRRLADGSSTLRVVA